MITKIFYLISLIFEKIGFSKGKIPVIFYHSIDNSGDIHSVTSRSFEKQMQMLYDKNYKTINLSQLRGFLELKKIPAKRILITFDDGYKNNLKVAKPILDKYGFRATVFVSTKFIGKIINRKNKTYKILDKADIKKLEDQGWDIANHFHSHRILTKLTNQEIRQEIKKSKKILKDLLKKQKNISSFVCPKNKVSKNIINILIKNNANLIFFGHGLVNKKTSNYKVPRIEIFSNIEDYKFLLHISWLFNFIKRLLF